MDVNVTARAFDPPVASMLTPDDIVMFLLACKISAVPPVLVTIGEMLLDMVMSPLLPEHVP